MSGGSFCGNRAQPADSIPTSPEHRLGPPVVNPDSGERPSPGQVGKHISVTLKVSLYCCPIRWLLIEVEHQVYGTTIGLIRLLRFLLHNSLERLLLQYREWLGSVLPSPADLLCKIRIRDSPKLKPVVLPFNLASDIGAGRFGIVGSLCC